MSTIRAVKCDRCAVEALCPSGETPETWAQVRLWSPKHSTLLHDLCPQCVDAVRGVLDLADLKLLEIRATSGDLVAVTTAGLLTFDSVGLYRLLELIGDAARKNPTLLKHILNLVGG